MTTPVAASAPRPTPMHAARPLPRRRRAGAPSAIIAALLPALAGCSGGGGGGPSFSSSGPQTRAAQAPVDHDAYARLGYRVAWRGFPVMTSGSTVARLDVFGDVVVAQDTANRLTLMESSTGRNRWTAALGAPLARFVGNARRENQILCSSDNELFILDVNTGETLDRHDLALVVDTPPVLFGSVAVYGSVRGEVLGHSLITRYKLWGYLLAGAINAAPTHVGDLVGAVSQGGDVIVINPSSGVSTARARIFGGLANNPVGDANGLYVASLDQSVYCFAAEGSELRWRHRAQRPITDQPTIHEGVLYVAIPGDGLVAFDAASGDILWKSPTISGEVIGVRDKRLLVWNASDSSCATLDPRTGDPLERATLPGISMMRLSAFEEGDLYTTTPSGVVARLVPKK